MTASFTLPASSPVARTWGRTVERAALTGAIESALRGCGGVWVLEGSAGIGKTRLARAVEEEAASRGFATAFAQGLRDSLTPFFAFRHALLQLAEHPRELEKGAPGAELPPLLLVEGAHPDRAVRRALGVAPPGALLVVHRERWGGLLERHPRLEGSRHVELTRQEGETAVSPFDLDRIADRVEGHLRSSPGRVALLSGVDYLAVHTSPGDVLHLVQVLHDVAAQQEGHLVLAVNASTLSSRDLHRLEAEGEVEREDAPRERVAVWDAPLAPGLKMLRALGAFENACRARPVHLVLDDVQWLDASSLRLLQLLARNAKGLPLLILATLRPAPSASAGDGTLEEVLASFEQEGTARRLPLAPLEAADSQSLVEAFLGGELAYPERCQGLFRRGGGNPYFLLSLARTLVEEGRARREAQGIVLDLPPGEGGEDLPPDVQRAVHRHVSRLLPAQRRLLGAAALLGFTFDVEALAGGLGRPRSDLVGELHALGDGHRFVAPSPGADGTWSFTHPMTWEGVLREVPEEEGRALSGELAGWWAERRPDEAETLARLGHQSADVTRGPTWVRQAIDRAMRAQAADAVERLHGWLDDLLLRAGADPPARVREGLDLVYRVLRAMGGAGATDRMLGRLEASCPAEELRWEVQALASSEAAYASPEESRRRTEEVRATVRRSGRPAPARVEALLDLAEETYRSFSGQWEESVAAGARVLARADASGDPYVRARALGVQAWSMTQLGRAAETRALLEELQVWIERNGLVRYLGTVANVQAALAESLGDARGYLEGAELDRDYSEAHGNLSGLAVARLNELLAGLLLGDLARVERDLPSVRALVRRVGDPRLVGLVRVVGADLLLRQGRPKEAVEEGRRGVVLLKAPVERWAAELSVAEALNEDHRPEEALAEVAEPLAHEAELPQTERSRVHLLQAEALGTLGRSQEARGALDRAVAMAGTNLLNRARALGAVAAFSRAHGGGADADRGLEEARRLLERSGVLPAERERILRGARGPAGG